MENKKPLFTRQGADKRSLAWFLAFRVAIITLFLGGTALFFLSGKLGSEVAPGLFLLLAVSYFQTILSALLLLRTKRLELFAQFQLLWDIAFITVLIYMTGGVDSVFSFVYLLVIVSGSFLLPRRKTIYVAGTAAIFYGGLLDLQLFGFLEIGGVRGGGNYGPYLYSVFVHVLAFLLTGLLSGTLAERWRHSEEELERKSIDYQELERLNRTIISHISSGLMIVNRRGRIRSFNKAAVEITGYSLEDVYDLTVNELFPNLNLFDDDDFRLVSRAESVLDNRQRGKIVVGYASTPVHDHRGNNVGLLVAFQDLTQLKEAEAQLQRSDRLAAVGRLASGLAHEIRNPLASISGSVQLLLEGASLSQEDARLMKIVLQESERLTRLLTDFLQFAKPRPPQIESIVVRSLLADLRANVQSDPRFANIDVDLLCSDAATLDADRNMLNQVLWNLALNAADAMEGQGRLTLRYDPIATTLIISDTGPGIPAEQMRNIFDPFYSTKEKGTGLGLTTVFALIEAHGGRIEVVNREAGGASFQLIFSRTTG